MHRLVPLLVLVLVFALVGCSEPTSSEATAADSTAADNVHVLSDAVTLLGKARTLRIYLPPDYADTQKRYPVLYMHDGQNIFDNATSYAGEWGIDEILNQLHAIGQNVPIVVAVDNGGEQRMRELGPWTHERFGESLGAEYANFMVNTLKRYVDGRYRTKPDVDHTAIMGSSMGGLMSHYLLMQYPDVYSKAGVFSPSFWFSENAFSLVETSTLPSNHRLFFVVGTEEGEGMAQGTQAMYDLHVSLNHPKSNLFINVVEGGKHTESFWQQHSQNAITWLFNETHYE